MLGARWVALSTKGLKPGFSTSRKTVSFGPLPVGTVSGSLGSSRLAARRDANLLDGPLRLLADPTPRVAEIEALTV